MRLKEYAIKNNITYLWAFRKYQNGKIPGAYKDEYGIVIVPDTPTDADSYPKTSVAQEQKIETKIKKEKVLQKSNIIVEQEPEPSLELEVDQEEAREQSEEEKLVHYAEKKNTDYSLIKYVFEKKGDERLMGNEVIREFLDQYGNDDSLTINQFVDMKTKDTEDQTNDQ